MPTKLTRSRWWMPGFCLFLGLVMFGAFAVGGDAVSGAICGGVMLATGAAVLVLGAWLFEVAHGRDGNRFTWLGAVAGVTYVLAVAILRRRS